MYNFATIHTRSTYEKGLFVARATKEDSEATARLILTHAARLFAERGYGHVGLEEIAQAASVTRGAVYHHFGSKQGMFEAVAEAAQQKLGQEVVLAAETEPDVWDGFRAGCRAFLTASLAADSRQILLIDAPSVLGWNAWRRQDSAASGAHLSDAITELAGSSRSTPWQAQPHCCQEQ